MRSTSVGDGAAELLPSELLPAELPGPLHLRPVAADRDMTTPFDRFEVLSFDCYGTLIDWEEGLWTAYRPLLAAAGDDPPARAAVLEAHARAEPRLQAATPGAAYETILERTHRAVAEALGLETSLAADRAFGASIPHWPAFADSGEALRKLAERFALVILSNVSQAGIVASIDRLGVDFDAIYTAQDIGSYKPQDANFRYLVDHVQSDFGVGTDGLLHVAQSLFHDHVPARRHGIANVWIDRQGLAGGGRRFGATAKIDDMPAIDHRFPDLASFASAAVGSRT